MAKITEKEMSIILSKIPNGACQMCGSQLFGFFEELVTVQLSLLKAEDGSITIGNGNPAVLATCNNCGHMVFLDAKILGLI